MGEKVKGVGREGEQISLKASPAREPHARAVMQTQPCRQRMCVRDGTLYGERAPAKIFINFSRKHALKMKNKQMYKCNLREIHYASLQKLHGALETAGSEECVPWVWGVWAGPESPTLQSACRSDPACVRACVRACMHACV